MDFGNEFWRWMKSKHDIHLIVEKLWGCTYTKNGKGATLFMANEIVDKYMEEYREDK